MNPTDRLTCEETFRRLDDYLDRTLGPDELRQVEAHLEECVVCAGEYRFETSLIDGVRHKLGRLESSPALTERLTRLLAQARDQRPT